MRLSGSLNDYCDFELDSKTKPDKPLVKGLLPLRHALIFALLSALLGLGISATLSLSALLFALAVLSAGTWYDLALKRTVFSWLPYTVLYLPYSFGAMLL
jgi:4-hydroxybenzoate polyprenyltransferase